MNTISSNSLFCSLTDLESAKIRRISEGSIDCVFSSPIAIWSAAVLEGEHIKMRLSSSFTAKSRTASTSTVVLPVPKTVKAK